MLELIEIILGVLEIVCDCRSRKETKAQRRASAARPSAQSMPDSNRIAASYRGGPASMPFPYTGLDPRQPM